MKRILFSHIDVERAHLTEESSPSTVIEDFEIAFIPIEADPVKIFADQLFQELSTSDVIRYDGVVVGSPVSRV